MDDATVTSTESPDKTLWTTAHVFDTAAEDAKFAEMYAEQTAVWTELLADYAHSAWSGWMQYLFSTSTLNADGTMTLPAWAVKRWTRQATTDYIYLPEHEKESDRDEARKIIALLS